MFHTLARTLERYEYPGAVGFLNYNWKMGVWNVSVIFGSKNEI